MNERMNQKSVDKKNETEKTPKEAKNVDNYFEI